MTWENLTIVRRWNTAPLWRRNTFIILITVAGIAIYILLAQGDPAACLQLRQEGVTDYRDTPEHLRLAAACNPSGI